jgi:hypothetical protein
MHGSFLPKSSSTRLLEAPLDASCGATRTPHRIGPRTAEGRLEKLLDGAEIRALSAGSITWRRDGQWLVVRDFDSTSNSAACDTARRC